MDLSDDDWTHLDEVYTFLGAFDEATNRLEGDEVTLDKSLRVLDFLHHHLKQSLELYKGHNHELHTAILASWYAFDKWYAAVDKTPIYAAAVLLHPQRRLHYFKEYWPKKWSKPALVKVRELYSHQNTEGDI